ncbi:MAG: hypothetical protein ACI9DK_003037 [Vicingaceae bacterium]|jgi:hypothetical protein
MNQTLIRLSFQLLLLTPIGIIEAQIEKRDLAKGKLISSEIDTSKKHQYIMHLKKNQFVFFKLMEKGIDLQVNTYNTLGEKLEAYDSPNYRNG